nr:ribonuclease H-like domain-containing protein [Tanacetum cinerariifolium]
MQEELLQFKLQDVWTLVDLPQGKSAIGSKWVFRNKMDERGIVIRNKAMLVAQGHTQDEEIYYDEVFAPVARIEAIRLFLAYASFKDFIVYQMDVKSSFLYGKIEEKVYVCQPPRFEDLDFPDKVYKVEKELYGLHQATRAWTSNVKKASTPMETSKPLLKDEDGKELDVHMYRSVIGSLMYLTSSRPDIMFAVCACARYQVKPKVSHLHVVKRIFRYLKGQPKLGLLYLKDSSFNLVAYTNNDYAEASLDRKSTTGGCQFLRVNVAIDVVKVSAVNSTMASAIICLANNQKFNFSKYILTSLVKNLEARVPFYMFPRKHKLRRNKRKETEVSPTEIHTEDHVLITSHDPLPSGEDRMQLTELMKLCKILSNKVPDLENEVIEMKSSHKAKIKNLESRVKKLEEKNWSLTKELKSFNTRVESPTIKATIKDKEESSKQRRKIADIDVDAEVNLENVYNLDMAHEETVLSMQEVVKEVAEEIVEVMEIAPTNITTAPPSEVTKTTVDITTTPKDKGIVFNDKEESITRTASLKSQAKDKGKAKPIFEMEYNKKVEKYQPGKKQKADELKQDNAKKQKLEEQEEAKELKKNVEIVPHDEENVFVNVTPLSSKPPTFIDYKIYKEGKEEHFLIFRANGNHQMYLAFSIMLKNFDREDLEVLWNIVKD